jgi:hypothetical protein
MHHAPLGGAEPYVFGPYFLAPFLLGAAAVLLELGLVERDPRVLRAALALPLAAAALAVVGHRPEPAYQEFLGRFTARLGGTPLYLSLLATVIFSGYAALRRVGRAWDVLTASCVLLAVVTPATLDVHGLVAPRPLPIFAAGALQLGIGARRRDAWRGLVGAVLLAGAGSLALPQGGGAARGPVAFHLVWLATLLVGAVFDDGLGRFLRGAGAGLGTAAAVVVMTGWAGHGPGVPAWAATAYPFAVAAVIAGYGVVLDHRTSLGCAGLLVGCWLLTAAWQAYALLRRVVTGLDYIAVGMVLFSLAVLTSLAKGGVVPWAPARPKGRTTHPCE